MAPSGYFDEGFLRRLEYLALVSRQVARGTLLARRRSRELGAGLEFAEHRPYTASEDFRHLDWNVFARQDQLLVKRFQEEQELCIYLLLDASESMRLGSPTKFAHAARLVAALAYVALADLDQVALSTFSDSIVAEFAATRGKQAILRILPFLDAQEPRPGATDLAGVLRAFARRNRRRGLAVVVGDWLDPAGYQAPIDLLMHQGHDVHVVHVFDRTEADPAVVGDIELIDVEGHAPRRITITEGLLRRYRRAFEEHHQGLAAYCRRFGLGFTSAPTDRTIEDLVLGMMRRPEDRGRGPTDGSTARGATR